MNAMQGKADLSGRIDRVIYHNADNGWAVVSVWPEASMLSDFGFQNVTVTGEFVAVKEGDHIDIEGEWINNIKYGAQLKLISQKLE
jgi:exodeoxyribonuclease V alpha subunit